MSAELSTEVVSAVGAVTGPPVLFLHGFCSSGQVDWPAAHWAQPLSARGRDVIVVDLPGHGASAPVAATLRASAVLRMLADLVAEAGGTVDVVGYSLGARLAWDLCAEPGLVVRRLAMGGLSATEPFVAVDIAAARTAIAGGGAGCDPLTAMIVSMTRLPGNDPMSLLNIVEGFAEEPFDPLAHPPACPALLLGGEDDQMSQGIDDLAEMIPDATIVRVPGDHVAAVHSPEFRAAVTGFLTR